MFGEFLYGVDQWLIAFVMMVLLFLSTEVGFRTGRKVQTGIEEDAKSQVSTISGAIIGVLALLLGFTFAMALARYERRKQLVLEESNAIGTAYLRSRLLPEPTGSEVAELLRSYVGARLDFYRG